MLGAVAAAKKGVFYAHARLRSSFRFYLTVMSLKPNLRSEGTVSWRSWCSGNSTWPSLRDTVALRASCTRVFQGIKRGVWVV